MLRCRPSRPTALNARCALDHMIRFPRGSPFTTKPYDLKQTKNLTWHETLVSREQKELMLGQRGCVLWFTGLSGSGKSTVACTLEHALYERGRTTAQLDGDNVRHGLNCNLGFAPEDREENIRRVGEVAKLFAESGILTMASFISPYRKDRDRVRELLRDGDFVEVYMKVPLEVCESRDPKGLYKKARAGLIKGFTGIDDVYEEPVNPEISLTTHDSFGQPMSPEHMAAEILSYLQERGYLRPPLKITTTDEPQLEWYI